MTTSYLSSFFDLPHQIDDTFMSYTNGLLINDTFRSNYRAVIQLDDTDHSITEELNRINDTFISNTSLIITVESMITGDDVLDYKHPIPTDASIALLLASIDINVGCYPRMEQQEIDMITVL